MSSQVAYNMDCMELMRAAPNKYFDLAVVDPIYGDVTAGGYITGKSRGGVGPHPTYNQTMWEQPKTGQEYFDELFRVSKNQIIWGGNYFVKEIAKGSQCWIVWDKCHPEGIKFADAELAWTSFDRATRIFRFLWNGMCQGISITAFIHDAGTQEMGAALESVRLTWATSKTPTVLELDGEALDANATFYIPVNQVFTETTTWTLKAIDERGAAATKSATLSFQNGIYYGAAAAPETIDSTFIMALANKVLSGTKNRTVSIRGGDGLFAWYAYPKRLGTSLFNIGGFDYEYEVETVPFTNQHGYEEGYYVYRSGQYAPASLSVTVKNGG